MDTCESECGWDSTNKNLLKNCPEPKVKKTLDNRIAVDFYLGMPIAQSSTNNYEMKIISIELKTLLMEN